MEKEGTETSDMSESGRRKQRMVDDDVDHVVCIA